jgi:hypothetical protein
MAEGGFSKLPKSDRLLKKSQMPGVEEQVTRRTFLHASVTRLEANKADEDF